MLRENIDGEEGLLWWKLKPCRDKAEDDLPFKQDIDEWN